MPEPIDPGPAPNPNPSTNLDYWFKHKRYGWGWTPVNREGRLVIAAFIAAVIIPAVLIGERLDESGWWLVGLLAWILAMVGILAIVTARHAPPGKWHWGSEQTDDPARCTSDS